MFRFYYKASKKKDIVLVLLVFLLSVGSFWSTYQGALIPLGEDFKGIALMVAVAIQGMLFLLLAGVAGRFTNMRKGIVIFVFSLFSIYTSFFWYHQNFENSAQVNQKLVNAEKAHTNFVIEVVTPFKSNIDGFLKRKNSLPELIQNELSGDRGNGRGPGNEYNKLIDEQEIINTYSTMLEETEQDITNYLKVFSEDNKDQEPIDIFEEDNILWQSIYPKYSNLETLYNRILEIYNRKPRDVYVEKIHKPKKDEAEPVQDDYLDSKFKYKFLTPIYMLFANKSNSKEAALASIAMSGIIDGSILLLGTAVNPRSNKAPFENVSSFIGQIIWGEKSFWKSSVYQFKRKAKRFVSATPAQTTMLRTSVYLVRLKLDGRGSDFLQEFMKEVDPFTLAVNYDKLIQDPDTTFSIGFRLVSEALRHPSLGWIDVDNSTKEWKFVDKDSYHEFAKWITEEIVYQTEIEIEKIKQNKRNQAKSTQKNDIFIVELRIPSFI